MDAFSSVWLLKGSGAAAAGGGGGAVPGVGGCDCRAVDAFKV